MEIKVVSTLDKTVIKLMGHQGAIRALDFDPLGEYLVRVFFSPPKATSNHLATGSFRALTLFCLPCDHGHGAPPGFGRSRRLGENLAPAGPNVRQDDR